MGGYSSYFGQSQFGIRDYFRWFLEDLVKRRLLDEKTSQALKPSGYGYYLFAKQGEVKRDNCFLIGDSAGLASLDLGEGIYTAIESGLLVADEILGNSQYSKTTISKFSLKRPLQWIVKPL